MLVASGLHTVSVCCRVILKDSKAEGLRREWQIENLRLEKGDEQERRRLEWKEGRFGSNVR